MNLGQLNIPKLEIDRFPLNHDITTKLFLQYIGFIEKTEAGQEILSLIDADPRVTEIKGAMLSTGNGAQRVDSKSLAMWFAWRANEVGTEEASQRLDSFLDAGTTNVLATQWVLGIRVPERLQLDGGLEIVPIEQMPVSREKDAFLQIGHNYVQDPKPQAAITGYCRVPKISSGAPDLASDYWSLSRKLQSIALLTNCIPGISCTPHLRTSYTPDCPPGPFGGFGGSIAMSDVSHLQNTDLAAEAVENINELVSAYEGKGEQETERIDLALHRMAQAKRRVQFEDKFLDLSIALEMLLLSDNRKADQLALTFRLRGSWLLGRNPQERKVLHRDLRDLYDCRSQVAHTGSLFQGKPTKRREAINRLDDFIAIAERVVSKVVREGAPDWTDLILGLGIEVAE